MRRLILCAVAILLIPAAAWATPGCNMIGGWPAAQYGQPNQLLTDSLPCYGITGTKNSPVVLQTSPTINTTLTVTGTNINALTVGRQGLTTPALQVNTNTASSITGFSIISQASGNGINLSSIGETNVPIIINAAGNGTINFNTTGTGSVNSFRNFVVNHDTSPTIQIGSSGGSLATIATPGTAGLQITTNTSTAQVKILHTASATNVITLTGSNGGNPTISTSAGDIAHGASIATTTTDATSTSTGAIKNTGGMSVNKRVFMNGLSADTASTDNTVCHNTSTNEIMTGTGAAGICLGTSSARYKRDIISAHVGLDELLRLRPVNFYYLPGRGGPQLQYGFLAEEVVDVIPSIVGLNRDAEPNSVDMMAMVPILVNAVKELKGEIDRKLDRSSVSQHRARSINRSGNVQ